MNTNLQDGWALPWAALRALPGIDGLRGGPLSPLGRIAAPAGAADAEALASLLRQADAEATAGFEALLDPGANLALWLRDARGERSIQALWPDPSAAGPGWTVAPGADGLRLRHPASLDALELELLDALALQLLPESEPLRIALDARQCWALLALLDAIGTTAALRLAARQAGPAPAVGLAEVTAAWEQAKRDRSPGWAVALAATLAPAGPPSDFPATLEPALEALVAAGWLLAGGRAGERRYAPGLLLDVLAQGLAAASPVFGLVRSERTDDSRIEVLAVIGFRLPDCVAWVDLSALDQDRAEWLLLGASSSADLLGTLLAPGEPGAPTVLPGAVERILQALAAPGVVRVCPACGATAGTQARYCGQCGASLA